MLHPAPVCIVQSLRDSTSKQEQLAAGVSQAGCRGVPAPDGQRPAHGLPVCTAHTGLASAHCLSPGSKAGLQRCSLLRERRGMSEVTAAAGSTKGGAAWMRGHHWSWQGWQGWQHLPSAGEIRKWPCIWGKSQSHPKLILELREACRAKAAPAAQLPLSSQDPFLCSSFHATRRALPPGCSPSAAADSTFIFGLFCSSPAFLPIPGTHGWDEAMFSGNIGFPAVREYSLMKMVQHTALWGWGW